MVSLDRRLTRLEGAGTGATLTRLLEWITNQTTEAPTGPLIECLQSLPIVKPEGIKA